MSVTIDNTEYFEANFIKKQQPTYFHGCSATIRKIIDKKKIPDGDFLLATYNKKQGYTKCDSDVKRAKLYLKKDWLDSNVPGFGNHSIKLEIEQVPPLLFLEEEEKFKDEKGNVVEIEVRGERDSEKIWFKASDVGKMLEYNDDEIRVTLMKKHGSFKQDEDYKIFIQEGVTLSYPLPNKGDNQKTIYLSYHGLVRLLMIRRHPIANHFQKWAFSTLFIHQFGTTEQKEELGKDLLGIDLRTLRYFLKTSVDKIPCLYLFYLGNAGNLREKIPNGLENHCKMYKYAFTDNLERRTRDHRKSYGERIQLVHFVYIDPKYLSKAETSFKEKIQCFTDLKNNGMKPNVNSDISRKEIISYDDGFRSMIYSNLKDIGEIYSGILRDLQHKLEMMKVDNKHKDDLLEERNRTILKMEEFNKKIEEEKDKLMNLLEKQIHK
jgi:prophage antirepressor-like protein